MTVEGILRILRALGLTALLLALGVEDEGELVNAGLDQLRNWQLVTGADWRVSPGV